MATLLCLPPELVRFIHSRLPSGSRRAFAATCSYVRSVAVQQWHSLRLWDADTQKLDGGNNNPLLCVPRGMQLRKISFSAGQKQNIDAGPLLLALLLPNDEEMRHRIQQNLGHVKKIELAGAICKDEDGHAVGRFLGSMTCLRTLYVEGGISVLIGVAGSHTSQLSELTVQCESFDSDISRAVAQLGKSCLQSLTIVCNDSCSVDHLAALHQLCECYIHPPVVDWDAAYGEEDLMVVGLLEALPFWRQLSHLRLPQAPADDTFFATLPQTLKSIAFGIASMSDIIRLASHPGLPLLRNIGGIELSFDDIRSVSDVHRVEDTLAAWCPGASVEFDRVYGVSCLEAVLCLYSSHDFPKSLHFFRATDLSPTSWNRLAEVGISVEVELRLDCQVEVLSTLHQTLDAMDKLSSCDPTVVLHGYVPGCCGMLLAFCVECATRRRKNGLHLNIDELKIEVTTELTNEISNLPSAWESMRKALEACLGRIDVSMGSMPVGYWGSMSEWEWDDE